MEKLRILTTSMALGLVLLGGCHTGSNKAASSTLDGDRAKSPFRFSPAFQPSMLNVYADPIPSRRSFLQSDIGRRAASPREYEREIGAQGRVEGSLIGRIKFPLTQYLDPNSRNAGRPQVNWPTGQRGSVDAFFVDFHPAVMEWPVGAIEGDDSSSEVRMTAYEGDGVPFAYGNCRRTVRVAGQESIRSGEQTFDDAVRMEADTELAFGWMATVRVHETAWFARGVGLVRREERFNGRALWLFRFGGASKCELADEVAPSVQMVADETREGANNKNILNGQGQETTGDRSANIDVQKNTLSRVAICFERNGRRIRLSGLAAEFGGSE